MKNLIIKFLIVILTLISVSGCTSTEKETNTPSTRPTQENQKTKFETPYIPEPGLNESTITGVLQVKGEPLISEVLYLAEIIYIDDETPYLAGFDRNVNINTQTNGNGRFIFTHVPVDEMYALVLDRFHISVLLKNPSDEKDLLFTPSAGEVLDLGVLNYDSLLDE